MQQPQLVLDNPRPALAVITAAVILLEEKEADVEADVEAGVEAGVHNAVTIRDLQEIVVDKLMVTFLAYVLGIIRLE